MKKTIFLLSFLMIIQNLFSQQPVQQTEPSTATDVNLLDFSVPFKKYVLDNGMTLIVNEDHSDQVVSIHLLFRIGASASPADMNGMMNIISKVLFANEQAEDYRLVQQYGGSYKYTLETDYLSCLITVPKHIYKQVLWYQAQKLYSFQQNLNAEAFTTIKQKAIEDAYKTVSSPEKQGFIKGLKGFYVFGHPYSWLPAGDPDKTELIELNDVKKFYHEWIGGNNLILTLSGDLMAEEAVKYAFEYFGNLPKVIKTAEAVHSAAFLADNPDLKNQEKQFFMTLYTDNEDFKTPVLYLFYPGVSYSDPARIAMEYAAYLLENPNYGLLYKSLIESKLAKEVSAKNYSYRSGGYFVIKIKADGKYPLKVFKDTVDYFMNNLFSEAERGTIKRLKDEKRSINPDGTVIEFNPAYSRLALIEELPFYKNKKLVELCTGAETTIKKCKILGLNELYYNNPNNLPEDIRQISNFAPQRAQKLCHESLVLSKPLIISVVNTEQASLQAGKENYSPQQLQTVILHPTDEETAKIQSIAFTAKKPKNLKITAFLPPKKEVSVLENGLKFSTLRHSETPMVNVLIGIDISPLQEQIMVPEVYQYFKALMESRINSLIDGNLKEQLDLMGVKYNVFIQDKTFYLSLTLLNENLQFTKEFIREYLWGGVRLPVDIEKISQNITESRQRPELLDYYNILNITHGQFIEMGPVPEFLEPNHKNSYYILQINEKLPFLLTPQKTTVTVTGNYRQGEIMDFRELFRQWQTVTRPEPSPLKADSNFLKGTYFLTLKKQNNPKVFIKTASIPSDQYQDQIKMEFIRYLMASMPDNLLSRALKDKKYISDINSGSIRNNKNNDFYFTTTIDEGSFILGLKEFDAALFTPAFDKIAKKEFKEIKTGYSASDFSMYQNDFHKAVLTNKMLSFDVPGDYYQIKFKTLKKLKPSGLQLYAQDHISAAEKVILIGGNREQHYENIKNGGFQPLIEIDENGFPKK